MRLGILGGTFNPPHLGHLAVASCARSQLRLERVLLMPSHTPPHKRPQHDPGPAQRLRMCELAVEGRAGLQAGALEVERGGPSFTVDTLLALHAASASTAYAPPDPAAPSDRAPSGSPEPSSHTPRLTLILGSDMARTLPTWRRAQEIVELADIAVAERPGDGRGEVLAVLEELGTHAAFLSMPPIEVSSSLVRERVAQGEPVEDLVGPAVAAYIAEQQLYRRPSGVPAS
jgi:nicotinate-nucleotide adenylyltransferase